MSGMVVWILSLGGVLTALVLLFASFARLRDEFVGQGWIARDGRLGRMALRGQTHEIVTVLQAVGLDSYAAEAIRRTAPDTRRRETAAQRVVDNRPDVAFLARARPWIYELEPARTYKGSRYYLDIMGAIDGRRDHEQSLDQIFEAWVTRLAQKQLIERYDVLIAPKDGNVLLCKALSARVGVPLILCKGEGDKARITRPDNAAPHETDFEGFRAFRESEARKVSLPGRMYRALAIDDSCANGSQLTSMVNRFNALSASLSGEQSVTFERVSTAVVLFRVRAGEMSNIALESAGLKLHALVAVGEEEMRELLRKEPKGDGVFDEFKHDPFSCGASIEMFGSKSRMDSVE